MKQVQVPLILLMLQLVVIAEAQTSSKKYNLKTCVQIALANNESVKSASLMLEHEKQLRKVSTEIPKTSFVYTQGQFNSIYKYDNNITLSQSLPNPLVFTTHYSLSNSQIKSSEYYLTASTYELRHKVEVCYYSLWYSNAIHHLLHKEDSIYDIFAKDAAAKFEKGVGSILEKTTAETQSFESKNQLIESEDDIRNFQIELQTLLQSTTEIEIEESKFEDLFLTVDLDTTKWIEHPLLKFYHQKIEIHNNIRRNQVAHALPDIMLGYFNQTIYGPANIFGTDYFLTTKNRLQGFQLGLSLPIWFYPQKAKIKAEKINTQIAESQYNLQKVMVNGQLRQALTMYLKYNNSIVYYKSRVINNLDVIIDQALKSYESKDITYIEYLQVVSNALQFQRNYLHVIHQNNMHVLKIRFLLGNF